MNRVTFTFLLILIISVKAIALSDPYNPNQIKYQLSLALSSAKADPESSLQIINESIAQAQKAKDRKTIHLGYITKSEYFLKNNLFDEALITSNNAYTIALEHGIEYQMLEAVKVLSEVHLAKDIKNESLEYLHRGLNLSKQLRDSSNISWFITTIPEVELEVGNVVNAMEYALNAKAYFNKANNPISLANTLLTISAIHNKLGNNELSKENIDKASKILSTQPDSLTMGKALYSYANLLLSVHKYNEAESKCREALQILKPINSKRYYRTLSLLGEIMIKVNNQSEALTILSDCTIKQEDINDISGLANTYLRLAYHYYISHQPNKAIKGFYKSISYSSIAGLNDLTRQAYKGLSKINGIQGNFKNAYQNLSSYTKITDSLFNNQKLSEASKLEEKAKEETHIKEIKSKEIKLFQQSELIKQQKQKQLLLYIIIAMFLVIIVFVFREFHLKKMSSKKLALQKTELEKQKRITDKKSRDFTDSLNYANRIQQAILRASEKLQEFFKESFIFLYPRDIVSGDFYWVKEKNDRILFALADCTGHGVPGALMSIIGTYGLNRLVNEMNITSPSEILNHINLLFEDSLENQTGVEIFDGMDIALCSYNKTNKELNYSGANIPLYILRKTDLPQPASSIAAKGKEYTLYKVRPNKQPIGSYFDKSQFINHSIQLMDNDTIYLFSDGYYDQFGGADGKKFRSTQLFRILSELDNTPLSSQKELLEKTFINWKGSRRQIDDVSFMSIRI